MMIFAYVLRGIIMTEFHVGQSVTAAYYRSLDAKIAQKNAQKPT